MLSRLIKLRHLKWVVPVHTHSVGVGEGMSRQPHPSFAEGLIRTQDLAHHVKITEKDKLIVEMLHSLLAGILGECKTLLDVEKLVSELQEFNEHNTCLMYNFELNGSYLLEYMDYLDQNLNDAPRYLNEVCEYLYGAEINDYVDHEKLEDLETRIKFLAENVGQFCFAIWVNEEGDDLFDIENKSSYLLFLAVLVELEMKRIFLSELSASKFIQSRTFKEKKLPKGFLHNLNSLLVHLRNKKLENFPRNVSAQNIDVAIEFLLFFLGDVPNRVINGNRLNEVSKKIGVLVGDILCVIQMLLGGSTIKAETIKIDLWTIQILEKIEDLKAQVAEYYKSLVFTPSHELPTVGGLSFLDALLRKSNEMLKSETGLGFMMKPYIRTLDKELSSLIYVFKDAAKVQHEHGILEDLRKHIINLAYEAEVSIDYSFSV
ncbi:hypothetical protein CQW23_22451 [Capsicum baccatum]|uniref:Uncharacterized protein n=1 Tax=Capsicum baccatum TaxID=33114 RepID=A0A2G2W0X1_CAPBA|nr:hypothetical protein CQW23_22451 [Capsicum baccatum]